MCVFDGVKMICVMFGAMFWAMFCAMFWHAGHISTFRIQRCHSAAYLKNELFCIIISKFSICGTRYEIISFTDIFNNY